MQISLVLSTSFGWSGRMLTQLGAPQRAASSSPRTPGCCTFSSTSLQHRAEALACLVSSAAQRKAGPVVFMFCKMFQMARGDFMIKAAFSVW